MKLWQLHGITGMDHVICGMMRVKLSVGLHQTKQENLQVLNHLEPAVLFSHSY